MANAHTKPIKITAIMSSAAFVKGFTERHKGKPLDTFAFSEPYFDKRRKRWTNDQWFYERGRQFASVYSGPIKSGRKLLNAAAFAYNEACKRGDII